MSKRILTLVCNVEQPEANWIWAQHMAAGGTTHGVSINAISNGDKIDELYNMEKWLGKIQEILDSGIVDSDKILKIQNILTTIDNK